VDWIVYQGIGVPSNPVFHDAPSHLDCRKISQELSVPLIRWIEDWDSPLISSFYGVIQDHHIELTQLKSQVRYEVKRASRNFYFAELSLLEILNEGFELYNSSFKTYDTYLKPMSKEEFIDSYGKYKNDGEKEVTRFFGIRETSTNSLVCYAYGIHYSKGNYFDLKVVKFNPEYQRNNISELLFFGIGQQLLSLEKMRFIFDGFVSMAHKSTIQEYLIRKFNYRNAYCKLCIHYKFYIRLFVLFAYPFRSIIKFTGRYFIIFHKLSILLSQEELRKNTQEL
jgi:hypothetical protein